MGSLRAYWLSNIGSRELNLQNGLAMGWLTFPNLLKNLISGNGLAGFQIRGREVAFTKSAGYGVADFTKKRYETSCMKLGWLRAG